MYLNELRRKVWTTDEHNSRYIFTWGKPSGWAFGFAFQPPHDSGGCYSHKRDAAGELVRVNYTHRSWSIEINFLFRGLYVARIKQRPVQPEPTT